MDTRFYNFIRKSIYFLIGKCVTPLSNDEDSRRQEFILNVILCGSLFLCSVSDVIILYSSFIYGEGYRGVSFPIFTAMVLIFLNLLILSRKGYFVIASYFLVGIYFLSILYGSYRWGIDLPASLLGYTILIIIASILLGTRFGFIITLCVGFLISTLAYFQISGDLHPKLYWRTEDPTFRDPILFFAIYLVIMTVSWLGNREIEKSLFRARRSEKALKHERDNLEITVEERTRELKVIQLEKMSQLYRFAEFGKLASGAFHDLMSSVTSLNLYIDELNTMIDPRIAHARGIISKAVTASKKMDSFISTIKKQTQAEGTIADFSLNNEIEQAIELLTYKARTAKVETRFEADEQMFLRGNALKFHQVVLNLISNAIDSYDSITASGDKQREVIVTLTRKNEYIRLTVQDRGSGIPKDLNEKIFEPFFTTKSIHKGTGLGLSTTKSAVEKDFHGTLEFITNTTHQPNRGTIFIIQIPYNHDSSENNRRPDQPYH